MIIRQSQTVSDSNILLGSIWHSSFIIPSMPLVVLYHHHFIPTCSQSSWMNAWFILLHRNTHVVLLSIKPGIYHLYHAGCSHRAWHGLRQRCFDLSFRKSKPIQCHANHEALRSKALCLRSWGKIYCCRFSLILDVRLGSPLNAGKIEGKRRDQNGLKCTYCVNMGNEVQMLLQKGKQSVSGALRSYSFSSALPMIFLDTFVIDTTEGLYAHSVNYETTW